ncbi:hypothetical protein [Chitinophaga ginsengisoli]|nr:hypothetical protein [Chitinophaga ginsengisoli]
MNKCVIAIAGHFDKQLYEMATSSLRQISVFDKAVKAFEENMKISYSGLMSSEKIHNRNSYLGYLNNRLGSVAFITFINGQPMLEILDFLLEEDKLGKPKIKCSKRKCDDRQTLEVLGESFHIDQLSDAQYDMLYNRFISQPDLLAAEFVSLEAGYHKESIAKPIDRFLLTNHGFQMLSPKRRTNIKNPYRY